MQEEAANPGVIKDGYPDHITKDFKEYLLHQALERGKVSLVILVVP